MSIVHRTELTTPPPRHSRVCSARHGEAAHRTEQVEHGAQAAGRQDGLLVLGDGKDRLVRIPPGVAHGARNIGQQRGRIIYLVDVQFSPDAKECDEGRLPWDHLGADVWEIVRG